jgi:hypothetical protein
MTSAPKRRWFRFSLRTLLVVVTVLGSVLGWVTWNLNWIRERHATMTWYKQNGCGPVNVFQDGTKAPWSIRILGEPGYGTILLDVKLNRIPTADDQRVKRQVELLFPESTVIFIVHGVANRSIPMPNALAR